MGHLGITSLAGSGPLNTMLPLGIEMRNRGHQITIFGIKDMEQKVLSSGLDFQVVGEDIFPLGSSDQHFQELSKMAGLKAVKSTVHMLKCWAEVMLQEAPQLIKNTGVQGLITNQGAAESGTIAEIANVPFVTVASALMFNYEPDIPPPFTTWEYEDSFLSRVRNASGHVLQGILAAPLVKTIQTARKKHGLRPYRNFNDAFSPLAQISQFPKEFEFPRKNLPDHFHFTGPFHTNASRPQIPFPWELLDPDKPLIYASFGSLQINIDYLYEIVSEACANLDVQLVISFGGGSFKGRLKGNPIAVTMAPQLDLLKKASLMITHGGTNSVMEALMHGIPVLAIPLTNDHPGCAARIKRSGVGNFIETKDLNQNTVRSNIVRILSHGQYRSRAQFLKESIRNAGGVTRACDIIEKALLD